MPRKTPLILIFEQHSFTSASEIATKLIADAWCTQAGFELPRTWDIDSIKQHYHRKKISSGMRNEASALQEQSRILASFGDYNTELVKVRAWFSSNARLKLLDEIEKNQVKAFGLDLTLEERESLIGHIKPQSVEAQIQITNLLIKPRDACITTQIINTTDEPTVCILGLQHAQHIIKKLREKNISFIPCYVMDSWAPDSCRNTLDLTYPPAARQADGLLECSSVDKALEYLREAFLPWLIKSCRKLEEPSSLTSMLSKSSKLPFFSLCSDDWKVSAVTAITNEDDATKAKNLQNKLGYGRFFVSDNNQYFGFSAVNMPDTANLQAKISKL